MTRKHSTTEPDNFWWAAIATILACIAIVIAYQAWGTPNPKCKPYLSTPDMMWTRQGGIHCIGWRTTGGRYFYQCDNDTNGVMSSGALFDDLQSVP